MNSIKKMLALFLALCCTFSLIVPTFASEIEPIEPMAEGTKMFQATLSIDFAGQASCRSIAAASSALYTINIEMSLKQFGNPIPLKCWNSSGTGTLTIAKEYKVSSGYDYQVIATITVKDSAGNPIESFTTQSSVVHY